MPLEVRSVRSEEYAVVGALTLAAYRALPVAPSEPYARELADVHGRVLGAEVFVAVEDERVLGSVTYVPSASSPYAESLGPGEAAVRMLAVDPAVQGRGVGAALVATCVARARADRVARLVLHSTPWMTAAHRVYARAGFRRASERDWTPVPEVPLWAFVLDLPDTVEDGPGGGTGETRGA